MSQSHEITALKKRLEASDRKIGDLNARLGRAENSTGEWRRRAQTAENECDMLKARLFHEQPVAWNAECVNPEEAREPFRAPTWLSATLMVAGAFTIIASAIALFALELYLVSDAWFLLALAVMAGVSMVAVGRHIRHSAA